MDSHHPDWGPPRTKTVRWWPPRAPAGTDGPGAGRDLLQGIIDGRYPPPPIATTIGSRLISAAGGEAVFRCTPDESFLNPLGLIHGGLLCVLMDSAMGVAVMTQARDGTAYASIELKISYLKPVPWDGRELEVRGTALRVGRRVAFAEAHAYDADGALVGHGTSSLAAVG